MIDQDALNTLFENGRTYNGWQDKPVEDSLIKELYRLTELCPTSANSSPARFKFIVSEEAKQKLKPYLDEGNVDKAMNAPVIAIIGQDMEFYEELPKLFPHTDAKSWFEGNDALIKETAFRNATLQGGYLIMAARALGLDTGPMSGFDVDGVTKEFFAGTKITANFLCNIGYGDKESLFPRSPRLPFEDGAEIL